MTMEEKLSEAQEALLSWERLGPFQVELVPTGLINSTFRVHGPHGIYILHRLNAIFDPKVNLDINAVTLHLQKKGVASPMLVHTDQEELFAIHESHCWRMQTHVSGRSFDEMVHPKMASEAGLCVGKFHQALSDFNHTYHFVRPGVHDLQKHTQKLENVLLAYNDRPLYAEAAKLGDQLLNEAKKLPMSWALPKRHSHGDLKVNNLLFDDQQRAICLVDLDTVGLMHWHLEMGDALRSWCNPRGEDVEDTVFDVGIFEEAIRGYRQAGCDFLSHEEKELLVPGVLHITLELAMRFLADVLEDCYFGWDPARFPSRSMHNWVRAKGQWALYQNIQQQRSALEKTSERTL